MLLLAANILMEHTGNEWVIMVEVSIIFSMNLEEM